MRNDDVKCRTSSSSHREQISQAQIFFDVNH